MASLFSGIADRSAQTPGVGSASPRPPRRSPPRGSGGGGPPPRARLSLWFGGVKRFRDISSVDWRLPAVFDDRLTPANTQLRTADSEPIQVKILSHFPPGRHRQGFQTDLHPPSTHRYARRLEKAGASYPERVRATHPCRV